ncbi:DUF6538 domain-containing protein [Roseinatronobacter thiooxidans]|nr:DUF6538 domain-containing protein [Roseinatronobacter thiooxidans]
MRGKTWHLRRRVPAKFAGIEPRREVWVSLQTDSRQLAAQKAPGVWESLVSGWEAQLAGRSDDGAARFEAARAIAGSHGVSYMPIRDIEQLPLEALLARIEVLQRRDGSANLAAAPAVLGAVEVPSITVSQALVEYWKLMPDRTRGKSEDQKRRWVNPRKKAVRNRRMGRSTRSEAARLTAHMQLLHCADAQLCAVLTLSVPISVRQTGICGQRMRGR